MLKKKQFVCLLSVGAMVAVLAGCSNSGVKFKNPVTITVWTYYNGDQLETFNSLVDKFNEGEGKKMGVTVESSSQGSVNDLETNVLAWREKSEPMRCRIFSPLMRIRPIPWIRWEKSPIFPVI